MTGRSLFTIDLTRPFVDALATGLMAQEGGAPDAMADLLVLLPTRRACRALREAFLRISDGRALLLPQMRPIGDIDEEELVLTAPSGAAGSLLDLVDLPPAIPELERLLQLSRLVQTQRQALAAGDPTLAIGPEQSLLLARELARLLDQVQTEGLSLDRLDDLVPADYADHWAKTVAFLEILRRYWPAYLTETGQIDPAERRNRLIEAQSVVWRETPPLHPVITAGSTGSIPATAALIATVAELPRGQVVLPGLDRLLDDSAWDAVRRDTTHPQYGMAHLLDYMGVDRHTVADWPVVAAATSRQQARLALTSDALRPAETTDRWGTTEIASEDAFAGVEWLVAPSPAAEAAMAAQCLREALETPGKTAALVTPDRMLARRAAAQLRRWNVEIDDSAGRPLRNTEAGRYFLLTAEAVASGLSPVLLLALMKHPLSAAGMTSADCRRAARRLERACLRGPKPAPGMAGLRHALDLKRQTRRPLDEDTVAAAHQTLDAIETALRPLLDWMQPEREKSASFQGLLAAHLRAAEALATTDQEGGADRLWRGDDGEALAGFIADLSQVSDLLGQMTPGDYVAVIATLLTGTTVRPSHGTHPRLTILGPLEARLQHADRLILAGLNEGVWPPDPPDDPWMSRDMRRRFGLPPHERRIGLSAHDFAQAFAASEVVLLRAEKSNGEPAVPARWLERLATVAERAGMKRQLPKHNGAAARRLAWQQRLDAGDPLPALAPPAPRPPVAYRPRQLSATRIETLIRDPYAIYARFVLELDPLDPLEANLGAADHGMIIHKALDAFVSANPGPLPPDSEARLLACGEAAFGADALANPAVRAFWWPRFERVARWFLEQERTRRTILAASHTEICGQWQFSTPAGSFTLSAEADRIDCLVDGGYAILDYKTGRVPYQSHVRSLAAPQLPLEAAILRAGGFPGIEPGPIEELAYWKLSGGDPPGLIQTTDGANLDALAQEVADRLARLIEAYDDETTPYRAVPRPALAPEFNDYAHLARVAEWSVADSRDTA